MSLLRDPFPGHDRNDLESRGLLDRNGGSDKDSSRKTRTHHSWLRHWQFVLCMVFHVLLIAAHLPLVIIGFNGHPLHLVEDRWYTKSFFYTYSFGPNFIGKVYLTGLLWYTQKLALKVNLHKEQVLTAIHDQAAAWLGLGPSLSVLWDQHKTPVSFRYVFCIFLYLAGLFVLGLTMPDLFSIGSVSEHETKYLNITSYLADVGTNVETIANAFPVVNLLPLEGWDLSTFGWQGDIIYDLPNFVASRPVLVSATRVQVQCKAVANANQSGPFDTVSGTYPFEIDPSVEAINIAPTNRAIYVLPLIMKNITNLTSQQAPSTMIVASTLPIQDDVQSRWYSVVSFDPPIVPDTCPFKTDCTTFSSLQLLACDTDFYASSVSAIPQVGLSPTSTDVPLKSGWTNWTLPAPPSNSALSLVNRFSTFAPQSKTIQKYHTIGVNYSGNYTFSTLETNLMDTLRFDHEDNSQINLGELETALQNAVAAVFWRASVRMALELQLPYDPPVQESRTQGAPFKYAVQISFWPPIIGLVASVILCLAAIVLTRHVKAVSSEHEKVETAGVLQLAWLMGTKTNNYSSNNTPVLCSGPEIANYLRSTTKSAGVSDLRGAGKQIHIKGWGIPG